MSWIDPSTRIEKGISAAEIRYIAGSQRLTYDQVKILLESILNETLRLVLVDLEMWIDKKVPKRTGQLRYTLKQNLYSSYVKNGILRIILGTHVDYAEFVNNMTTMRVRHFGEIGWAYYWKFHGPLILDDPEAVGGFFDEFLKYARERVTINLIKAQNIYLAGRGVLGRMISSRLHA